MFLIIPWETLVESKFFEIICTSGLIVFFALIRAFFRNAVKKHSIQNDLEMGQRKYAHKFINSIIVLLFLVGVGLVWDITFSGLSVYLASIFTIVGVALFANWSILSNVTSSLIIFFTSPFKIGSQIMVMDKDFPIKGTVMDINFFTVQILNEEGHMVSYPNNLALQKPIMQVKKFNEE